MRLPSVAHHLDKLCIEWTAEKEERSKVGDDAKYRIAAAPFRRLDASSALLVDRR